MQEERRKFKRLDLDVKIQLQCISEGYFTTEKYLHVDVLNASEGGLAFKTPEELNVGVCYDTKIKIWTQETIPAVIKIVRVAKHDDGYEYGCIFVGMAQLESNKIKIYQMVNDN